MSEKQSSFEWNAEYFEKHHSIASKLQLGMIGLAIGLLLMDLAKPYTLIPLGAVFLWATFRIRKLEELTEQFDEATIKLAPRSLLLSQPALEHEERIQFRDLKAVEKSGKDQNFTITLILNDERLIDLTGFINGEECYEQLHQVVSDKAWAATIASEMKTPAK